MSYSVNSDGSLSRQGAQQRRRVREALQDETREEQIELLRDRLRVGGVGRRGGATTPATPGGLLGEGGRGIRREQGVQAQAPDRLLTAPTDLPGRMPQVERRAGAERLHPTSTRNVSSYGAPGFSMRDIKDLVEPDSEVGIEPSENPFVMSLWTHVSKENDKHKNKNCSVVGNLAPRRGLARKIKVMSLNPSVYGNKYSVLGNS